MGPLTGFKVVEFAAIGPGPMCAMLLADLGAEVIRIDRVQESDLGVKLPTKFSVLLRGRRSVAIDMKKEEGVEAARRLIDRADALIEGFRPGVMERLGVGPDECLARNPKLVFGRMTGWGQDGPLAHAAGHDMNYIALTGALNCIGSKGGPPVPPLNLIGDFGGGALYLAFGIVCALLEAARSGQGQVVDAAMVEGAASLMTATYGYNAMGMWNDERGTNILDSGAHFYQVYETKDGKHVSIASIEAKFYDELLERAGLDKQEYAEQMERGQWPAYIEKLAAVFKTKTRDEWREIMEGTDICFAPVLSMDEAPHHPHNAARGTFIEVEGVVQPGPAPRFSRTPGEVQRPPAKAGEHTDEILGEWGFSETEIAGLRETGVLG
jgi:alpha-methylacyl-CoA racemase